MIPAMFRSVTRYVDVCIHPCFRHEPELLYRARVLSGLLQLYLLMIACLLGYLLLLAPVSGAGLPFACALCTALGSAYVSALHFLRTRGEYTLCAVIAIASTWLVIVTAVAFSGGPLASPALPVSIIPVIMAFCLQGRVRGMVWANAVFIGHWLLLAVAELYPLPDWLATGNAISAHVVGWAIVYVALTGVMLIFDSINYKLKRDRDREHQRYEFLASHDALTGLMNRMQFERELDMSLARAQRQGRAVAVVMMDLDGFKQVNDTYGHHAGDIVLQDVAKRLQSCLRKTDSIARLGGDEFGIVLDGVGNMNEVTAFSEKIIRHVRAPLIRLGEDVRVGASIGIALYPQHSHDADTLCRFADKAMYQAKVHGNRWCLYAPARQRPPVADTPAPLGWPKGLATGKV